jgi:hypothetical protein
MKYLSILIIAIISSIYSYAQTESIIKVDSSKLFGSTFRLNLANEKQKYYSPNQIYSFNFKSTTRFTLYSNPLNCRNVLYDNYRNDYINNNALQPYSNFGSAIIGGSINYLIMLLEKKK